MTDRIRAVRGLTRRLVRLLPVVVGVVALTPAVASAQQVNITPASSITPDSTITSWIVWMGIATAVLGVIIVLFLLFGYLRFAPKFFGREAPPKAAPGARPAFTGRTPVDQRAPVGAVRPFTRGPEEGAAQPASASAAQPAASASAVATLERPAAGGEAKPEPSGTGGTAEEPPPEEGAGGGAEDEAPPTEYEQDMAEVEAEEAQEAPAAQAEAAPAGEAEAPAPAARVGSGRHEPRRLDDGPGDVRPRAAGAARQGRRPARRRGPGQGGRGGRRPQEGPGLAPGPPKFPS